VCSKNNNKSGKVDFVKVFLSLSGSQFIKPVHIECSEEEEEDDEDQETHFYSKTVGSDHFPQFTLSHTSNQDECNEHYVFIFDVFYFLHQH
jgi:hypothetical protein